MSRVVEFADAMPPRRHGGRTGNLWAGVAEQLRTAGKPAGRLDRKGSGVSKTDRERATAAGLRVSIIKVDGVPQTWVELVDAPAEPGPPPIAPTAAPVTKASKPGPVRGTDVTVAEFVECHRRLGGAMPKVRAELVLTLGQFEELRALARRDGLL